MSYNGGVFCYTQTLQLSYILPVLLTVVHSSNDFNCCGDIVLGVAFLVVFCCCCLIARLPYSSIVGVPLEV